MLGFLHYWHLKIQNLSYAFFNNLPLLTNSLKSLLLFGSAPISLTVSGKWNFSRETFHNTEMMENASQIAVKGAGAAGL